MFTSLLKDTDEQPDDKRHRTRSERVPSTGDFCPCGVGVHPLLIMWMCSPTWKLSEPNTVGILRTLLHVGMIYYERHFQPHPLRVTSIEQQMLLVLLSLRNLQCFQESYVKNREKDQICFSFF